MGSSPGSTSHGRGLAFGRLYSAHSAQSLSKPIRNICADGRLSDIDIDNCYPTVLLQVSNRNGIKTPVLRRYVEEREQIIGTLLTKYPRLNRERVKNAFIVSMHNGNYMTNAKGGSPSPFSMDSRSN
jgi:hypothetical protein